MTQASPTIIDITDDVIRKARNLRKRLVKIKTGTASKKDYQFVLGTLNDIAVHIQTMVLAFKASETKHLSVTRSTNQSIVET